MMTSLFLQSESSEPMPIIARSQDELGIVLLSWMQEHNWKFPPRAIQGSILNVKDHVSRRLIFTGTSETIFVDRLLIHEKIIGWVLRAPDGSCMYTKHDQRNSQHWRGYKAWLGGDLGFTKTVLASSDGNHQKPSKRDRSAVPRGLDATEEDKAPKSDTSKFNSNPGSTEDSLLAVKLENRAEGHRYPTRERRLAMFGNDFEVWELQGNRGVHTPPQPDVDAANSLQWVPWHPGTSHSTPQTKSKRQTPKLQEAASICSNRTRSPSFEMTSEIRESPRRHGRSASAKSHFSPRKRTVASGRLIAKLPVTPKTPSRRSSSLTITPSPTLPKSKKTYSKALLASPPAAYNVIFHFFLSKESLGAIPKLFAQCATPHEFFHEARQAWHILGGPDDGARLLGVKVVIEGVARPIVLLWDSTDGFERMVEAITKEVEGKTDSLNVEVSCIKQE